MRFRRSFSRTIMVLCCMSLCLILSGCESGLLTRRIGIVIPVHPWEKVSGEPLWYSIEMIGRGYRKILHCPVIGEAADGVSGGSSMPAGRRFETEIPLGKALVVLAVPLGYGCPFGGFASPGNDDGDIVLSQREGVIAAWLALLDGRCLDNLNFPALISCIEEKTSDFRRVSRIRLLDDIGNNRLSGKSVSLGKQATVENLDVPPGLWVSEFAYDGGFLATASYVPAVTVSPGAVRYMNFERNLMLSVFCSDGLEVSWSLGVGVVRD